MPFYLKFLLVKFQYKCFFFLTNKEITALCYNIFNFQNLLESEKEKMSVKSKQKPLKLLKLVPMFLSSTTKNDQKKVIHLQAL